MTRTLVSIPTKAHFCLVFQIVLSVDICRVIHNCLFVVGWGGWWVVLVLFCIWLECASSCQCRWWCCGHNSCGWLFLGKCSLVSRTFAYCSLVCLISFFVLFVFYLILTLFCLVVLCFFFGFGGFLWWSFRLWCSRSRNIIWFWIL